jgi:hypothetical protein
MNQSVLDLIQQCLAKHTVLKDQYRRGIYLGVGPRNLEPNDMVLAAYGQVRGLVIEWLSGIMTRPTEVILVKAKTSI